MMAPSQRRDDSTDTCPRRTLAADICAEGGVLPEAIAKMIGLNVADAESKTVLWWIDAIRLQEAVFRQEAALQNSPVPPPASLTRKRDSA
jgi:hypothetical protein